MFEIEFSIWLASKKQWVHLVKVISLSTVPRVGEFIKFENRVVGDYFGWKISEVTYRENGKIEVSTELLDNIDQRMYSFEEDEEFQEYYESYLAEGWISPHGIKANTQFVCRQPKA
ncbi:hypothetical protein [Thaumasiovibrio sp. DFM-14]|uniref:hypothetical protein n=1 Tax=Thaumasiovibrio sp. DFM-14 TaxID=3384792 RepID=UPI0039A37116